MFFVDFGPGFARQDDPDCNADEVERRRRPLVDDCLVCLSKVVWEG